MESVFEALTVCMFNYQIKNLTFQNKECISCQCVCEIKYYVCYTLDCFKCMEEST